MKTRLELEATLIADPTNVDAYLVYADVLQAEGDPRGELIALQHGGKVGEAAAFIEAHADALYGPLKNYRKTLDGSNTDAFEWRLGFLRSARLSFDSNCVDEVEVEGDEELALDAGLAALLAHPSGMLLEELVIPINMLDDGAYFEPVVKVLAERGAPTLKTLRIGAFSCAGGPGGEGDYEYEISWTSLGDASALWKAVPRLERLVLQVGLGSSSSEGTKDTLGRIDLPNLRHLEVITGGLGEECLRSLANANLPALTYMDLWFGSDNYGGGGSADDLAPILDGAKFPSLRHLGLMNCEFTDAICERLGAAKILPRLQELSLRYGTMSDEGALALAHESNAFAHLTRLDVSDNCLGPDGVAAVARLCSNVVADEQKGEDDRYASLTE